MHFGTDAKKNNTMKKFSLLVGIAISTTTFAQKIDCSKIKDELTNVKTENAELLKQNNYYKETLDLLKPLKSNSANNLDISIIRAVGNKESKMMTISYLYQNTSQEVRKYFQASQSYFVDERGNQSQTYEVYASANKLRVEQIQPNIPMKGLIKFKIEEVDFPIIKHLNLKFSYVGDQIGKTEESVIFQNIPVTWE